MFEPSFQIKEEVVETFDFLIIYDSSMNDLERVKSFLDQRNEPLDIRRRMMGTRQRHEAL